MTVVVGVDGGGTGTRAVLVDPTGRELGRAEGGASLVTLEDPRAAAHTVSLVVEAAAERARIRLPVAVLWAGLAGAGSRSGREAVEARLSRAGLADRVRVGTDAQAAFRDAFADGPGILLVAGTGSIAWARNGAGVVRRVGGWGTRLGDEGSGYRIGLDALRAVVRDEDGRGPRTEITEAVLAHVGVAEPGDLVAWVETASKGDLAALARIVTSLAEEGDLVADEILGRAVNELEAHLAAALDRAAPWIEKPPLVLWGGLLRRGGPLRERLLEAVVSRYPVEVVDAEVDAALGAAKLALRSIDRAMD